MFAKGFPSGSESTFACDAGTMSGLTLAVAPQLHLKLRPHARPNTSSPSGGTGCFSSHLASRLWHRLQTKFVSKKVSKLASGSITFLSLTSLSSSLSRMNAVFRRTLFLSESCVGSVNRRLSTVDEGGSVDEGGLLGARGDLPTVSSAGVTDTVALGDTPDAAGVVGSSGVATLVSLVTGDNTCSFVDDIWRRFHFCEVVEPLVEIRYITFDKGVAGFQSCRGVLLLLQPRRPKTGIFLPQTNRKCVTTFCVSVCETLRIMTYRAIKYKVMSTEDGKRKLDSTEGPPDVATDPPHISMVVLETSPTVKKYVTKRYHDCRTLSLLVVDNKVVEKSLTFRWDWDYDLIEKEKGKGVSFKYWVKGGLEVSLTYFGSYLFGKMFTLDYSKVTNTAIVAAEDWHDEVTYDIAFPMVNIGKIRLEEGFIPYEKDNPFMQKLMHDMVLNALSDRHKTNDKKVTSSIGSDNGGDSLCDLCGENPCVWVCQREAVIAIDEDEHGPFAIVNKTRRFVGKEWESTKLY
jgi:hypothetical protein